MQDSFVITLTLNIFLLWNRLA